MLFKVMSALKINFIPIGEVSELNNLAQFFGCGLDYIPSSYLGLPSRATYKCKVVWEPMVERFQKKLAEWKSKLFSRGGRLTLLQSYFWSLPSYFVSFYHCYKNCSLLRENIEIFSPSPIMDQLRVYIGLNGRKFAVQSNREA